MNAVGTNTAISTSAVAMIGLVTSRIACCAAAMGARPRAMLRSTFSTTTIASSTTMPIASTRPNSDSAFSEKPNEMHHRERADERHGHGRERNHRRAPGLQEQHDHEHDEQQRFEQRVHDGVDRLAHEHRRVVDDVVVDALRKVLRELRHLRAHLVRDVDRVAAGPLIDRDRGRGLVVEQRAQRVGARAELDARDVAESRDLAVLADLHALRFGTPPR